MKTKKWIPILTALIVPLMTGCGGDNGSTPANHAPVARAQRIVADEDTAKTFTLQGSDEDNDSLTYTLVTQPAHGALSGTAPNLTYTPAADWHGDDRFTFTVNDGNATSSAAEVNITVKPVNDAPVAVTSSYRIDANKPFHLTLGGSDVEGDPLEYDVSLPDKGELKCSGAECIYEPDEDFNGTAAFRYRVYDGQAFSTPQTITVVVLSRPFKITVKTDNPGTSADNEFTIMADDRGGFFEYKYRVDCGDGSGLSDEQNGNYTCRYDRAGTYTISIHGRFPAMQFPESTENHKLVRIDQWGTIRWKTMESAFSSCDNIDQNPPASDRPILTDVDNMSYMFAGSSFDQDINDWDVRHVTDMIGIFAYDRQFNGNISDWNISNVRYVQRMFEHAEAFNQDIGKWDVSHVWSLKNMFKGAVAFDQDISDWNISHAYFMNEMLTDSNLSQAHYDALLTKWSALPVRDNVYLGVPATLGCSDPVRPKRNMLVHDHRWHITDKDTTRDSDDDGATDDDELRADLNNTDPDEFLFGREIYHAVTSAASGKKWLDRNLGASQSCTALNDTDCYGDYYQWGRHYPSTGYRRSGRSRSIDSWRDDQFYRTHKDWVTPGVDDDGRLRQANWQNLEGTFTCPKHYRLPTAAEWQDEIGGWGDLEAAFGSELKIPSAGYKDYTDASDRETGAKVILWTQEPVGTEEAKNLIVKTTGASIDASYRANGAPVRCIHE